MSDDFVRDFGTALDRAAVQVASGERSLHGRTAWRSGLAPMLRPSTLVTAAVLAVAVVTAFAVRSNAPQREVPAVTGTPSPSDAYKGLPSGEPASAATLRQLRDRFGEGGGILANLQGAYTIPAPPAGPDALGQDASEWVVVPNAQVPDGDRLCVVLGFGTVCVPPQRFSESGAVMSLMPGSRASGVIFDGKILDPQRATGPGPAKIFGLLPPEVTKVVALAPNGDEIASTEVRDQTFSLTVPSADGLEHVELQRADGTATVVENGGSPYDPEPYRELLPAPAPVFGGVGSQFPDCPAEVYEPILELRDLADYERSAGYPVSGCPTIEALRSQPLFMTEFHQMHEPATEAEGRVPRDLRPTQP